MNKTSEGMIQRFREKFTSESPRPEYREMKHEYYLNCTDVEQFLLEAVEEARREENTRFYLEIHKVVFTENGFIREDENLASDILSKLEGGKNG